MIVDAFGVASFDQVKEKVAEEGKAEGERERERVSGLM